ncbi:MAG: biopolymer transporter ExbD [Verrucomicrobiota bacterium]|nr:biopolymer transporter ExbD [Limisphaerales bacterium]
MRRFSQRSHLVTLSEINITPLLDLAFVLLIIFIITTPLMENGLPLKLPVGRNPSDRLPDQKNVRVVDIDSNGRYAMNKRFTPLNQLVASLAQQYQANPNLVIYIRADENSRMRDFVALTDACTSKGISKYQIRTQPPGSK